jgi:hypothetical protein
MERDAIVAHGAMMFIEDSFLTRGDEYFMAICNMTGTIAIYNKTDHLLYSPFSDGPLQFTDDIYDKKLVEPMTKYGVSFSVVRIPYAFKLLLQELQVMNIQMRVITEDNIDQMTNLGFSKNIYRLLHKSDDIPFKDVIASIDTKYSLVKSGGGTPITYPSATNTILNITKNRLSSHDLQLIPVKYVPAFVSFFESLEDSMKERLLKMDYLLRISTLIDMYNLSKKTNYTLEDFNKEKEEELMNKDKKPEPEEQTPTQIEEQPQPESEQEPSNPTPKKELIFNEEAIIKEPEETLDNNIKIINI